MKLFSTVNKWLTTLTSPFQETSGARGEQEVYNQSQNDKYPFHNPIVAKRTGLSIIILGLILVFGSTTFGVGTFAYTESTNTIEVTDGTSGAPATFNDMYTADQAGTGTVLLAATA